MDTRMTTKTENSNSENVIIGSSSNFWKYSTTDGFNLTRSIHHGDFIRFETTTVPIMIDPARSALVIIDMQNMFLHPAISSHSAGLAASEKLLQFVIPAARKVEMQIIWLNWGLTEKDVDEAPPSLKRTFGVDIFSNQIDSSVSKKKNYIGIGEPIGDILLADGSFIEAGRLLMCNSWHTRLYDPLFENYKASLSSAKPDEWFHKNRISGMWSQQSPIISFLERNGITTLFFAGVNTDQCVSGTLQDAYSKGFDCILLRDACGTTSPLFAQQCIEYNCTRVYGFVIESEIFAKCIKSSQSS